MLNKQSMTAYQMDNLIMEKYHSKLSPSVTYAKLATMERQKLIECHLDDGKIYSLLEKGKQLLEKKTTIVKEIRSEAITLFEN
jgi:DNA-binding PadR family transcriptional regulator